MKTKTNKKNQGRIGSKGFDPIHFLEKLLGWGLFIFLSIYIFDSVIIKGYLREYKLRRNGVCSYAYVTAMKDVRLGRHGNTTHVVYTFWVDGLPYEGESPCDNLHVGDSLKVVYLMDNPRINMSNTRVKLECHE